MLTGYCRANVNYPEYLGVNYDASTTNLTYSMSGGKGEQTTVVISFFSPITPTSTFFQSLPAGYIQISVSGSLRISVYIDMSSNWSTRDGSGNSHGFYQQDIPHNGGILPLKSWRIRKAQQQEFVEDADRAMWGDLSFTGSADSDHCAGTALDVRNIFASTGELRDERQCVPQGNTNDLVFAFSKKLGTHGNSSTEDAVLFTIAHTQDPVVQFAAARGLTKMRPLWASWFNSLQSMIQYHYLGFQTASELAANYSAQLTSDAISHGGDGYADILALSARQVMGATTFSGTAENPLLFLKEISSNGDMQTVDVIFPAFPFFLYTNPRWLAYLLEPLIEHQLSGQYPNKYSLHDIGIYPNGLGHPDGRDEYMPVEECGNMLIMGLALANSLGASQSDVAGSPWATNVTWTQTTDDCGLVPLGWCKNEGDPCDDEDKMWGDKPEETAKEWLSRSHILWKQWTGYLVRESLIPANQLSTDDFAGWLANQTNLALKGIIGIRAMADISAMLGEKEDAKHYRDISETYADKWQEYAISRDGTHAKVAYTWQGSWTTTYNLFSDAMLCFHLDEDETLETEPLDDGPRSLRYDHEHEQRPLKSNTSPTKPSGGRKLVPDQFYNMQSDWYHNVMQRYGLPLDSRHLYTKSDWQFFAASVASTSVRSEIVEAVSRWVNETVSDGPFTDLYETEGKGEFGAGNRFLARPVVGGHFAGLALSRACGGRAQTSLKFLDDGKEAKEKPAELEGCKSTSGLVCYTVEATDYFFAETRRLHECAQSLNESVEVWANLWNLPMELEARHPIIACFVILYRAFVAFW